MTHNIGETSTTLDLEPLLGRLLAALCREIDDLCAAPSAQILVVFASARGEARASVRGLCRPGASAQVLLQRGPIFYELSLRPRWFLASSPRRRLESLIHELWHIGAGQEGALDPRRAHQPQADRELRQRMPALIDAALQGVETAQLDGLAHDGEVLLPAWLRRPLLTGEPGSGGRFDDDDLYPQRVPMRSPAAHRMRWLYRRGADSVG